MSIQFEYDRLNGRRMLLEKKRVDGGLTPLEMVELESVTERVDQVIAALYPLPREQTESERIQAVRQRMKVRTDSSQTIIPPKKKGDE